MKGLTVVVFMFTAALGFAVDFSGAAWIWGPLGKHDTGVHRAEGTVVFRKGFSVTEVAPVQHAEILITADNLYTVYLNGNLVGESNPNPDQWKAPKRFDVSRLVSSGWNILALAAANTKPGPAGLLVRVQVTLGDGQQMEVASSADWKVHPGMPANWQQPECEDQAWGQAVEVAAYGTGPWGTLSVPKKTTPAGAGRQADLDPPPSDMAVPDRVVFVGEDCSLYRGGRNQGAMSSLNVTVFNPRDSRSFPEHDLPGPMKVGRKLLCWASGGTRTQSLVDAEPQGDPAFEAVSNRQDACFTLGAATNATSTGSVRVLVDAGQGALGSPSVTFDGAWILFSMVPEGGSFFHLYRVRADGTHLEQLTDGPYHDIDPVERPDGRIVFVSTRRGTFEEYHNTPSRALFVMQADGRGIVPLTHTFIFDNEPEVMADGRLMMIRSDNFFDRGKVETRLHAVHPDGTTGYTEFGLDLGPEYGGRLRAFNCGSPAPMPDGRVAYLTASGIAVGHPGSPPERIQSLTLNAGDVAALPDGRLLCTMPGSRSVVDQLQGANPGKASPRFQRLALLDPDRAKEGPYQLYCDPEHGLHSPVFLGARPRPPTLSSHVDESLSGDPGATGVLYCQDARKTRNTTAGWDHVRAVRVLMGKGLTLRSSHSYIVHAGSEVVELGTVPLAPDGSFAVEVPADRAIAFQMVDAEGRSELNEMSWIFVRPGERRGCTGCHAPRQAAPSLEGSMPMAFGVKPLKLTPSEKSPRFRGNNAAVTGLMELQFDRFREIAGINTRPHPDRSETGECAAWIASLGEDALPPRDKVAIVQQLALRRSSEAESALARLLFDDDEEVQAAAALALASCGTRASVQSLNQALSQDNPYAAQAACVALENITGRPFEFNPFAPLLERKRGTEVCRTWLGVLDWSEVEAGLIQRLQSTSGDTIRRAAVSLGRVGEDAAREALRDYVTRARSVNPYPEWKKKHKGDGTRFNALSEANPRSLQAAVRALGSLEDKQAVPMLLETLEKHADPETGNLFLAEACVEALMRISEVDIDKELGRIFKGLKPYWQFTNWYGDHPALMACHASPVHALILRAWDARETRLDRSMVPHLLTCLPTDPDRALLHACDDVETVTGRTLRRSGWEALVVETCLAVLGDPDATADAEVVQALGEVKEAWAGTPGPEIRAAQVLSVVARDPVWEQRVLARFDHWQQQPVTISRVFATGIPVVDALPQKHWIAFYLARTLGYLGKQTAGERLVQVLKESEPEAAEGHPDPLGPGQLFLHNDLTPCWRAEVAWALGRIGESRAVPVLAGILDNLDNAPDTRFAAARALRDIGGAAARKVVEERAPDYPDMAVRRELRDGVRSSRTTTLNR